MTITKKEFYRLRGTTYQDIDPEAVIRYERILPWISSASHTKFCEIGCKFAILRDLLQARNQSIDYIGIDIDAETLKKIPVGRSGQLICHDVNEGIPVGASSVDVVICLEVLEHLENPSHFLREVRRIIRPSGRAIISVPNPYCWMELVGAIRLSRDTEGHVASFSYTNMDALLSFEGFRLIDRVGTYTRIPYSNRLLGRTVLARTSNLFLTRSYIYIIERR